ncbi:hypothetical protein Dimus_016586 [Dionaea muscipula]
MAVQVQKPTMPVQNQYLLQAQQQQVLSMAQSQNSLGSSPSYGDMDPRRFGGLPKGSLNAKEAQSSRNDVCSPMQSSSSQRVVHFIWAWERVMEGGAIGGEQMKGTRKRMSNQKKIDRDR